MRTALAITCCWRPPRRPMPGRRASAASSREGVALYDIRATGVSCEFARDLGRRWRSKLVAGECAHGRFRCRVRGYICHAKPPAQVHYPVTCRKDSKRVRWQINAD